MPRVRQPDQPGCPVLRLVVLTMSEKSVPVSIEQHIIIKFLIRKSMKSAEIYRRLHAQFWKDTLSWSKVKVSCNVFRQGRECVTNQAHPRRPCIRV